MPVGPIIQVNGIKSTRRRLRKLEEKELLKEMRNDFKSIADLVAMRAASEAPERTGRLKRTIKGQANQTGASVKAGTDSRVKYAGPIHWGWKARGIDKNQFIMRAVIRLRGDIERLAEQGVRRAKRKARL